MFWCVRPIVRDFQQHSAEPEQPLTIQRLCTFYWPLALTPLITLATLSIGSAAISRMPRALESLAVWPVLGGLTFMFRSVGIAVQEVVVTFSDRPHFLKPLQQFVWLVSLGASATLLLIAATPLSTIWFESVAALSPELSSLASTALWMAVVLPAPESLGKLFPRRAGLSRRHDLCDAGRRSIFIRYVFFVNPWNFLWTDNWAVCGCCCHVNWDKCSNVVALEAQS